MYFRDAVKLIKYRENYTQTDIANRINVTKSYLSNVLRGYPNVSRHQRTNKTNNLRPRNERKSKRLISLNDLLNRYHRNRPPKTKRNTK